MRVMHDLGMNDEPESSADVARATGTDRITVALVPKAAGDLTRLQQRTSLGKTDVVNRAISLYEFIQAQLDAENDLIVRDRRTGETQLVRFL
jgi:hypothetical protein